MRTPQQVGDHIVDKFENSTIYEFVPTPGLANREVIPIDPDRNASQDTGIGAYTINHKPASKLYGLVVGFDLDIQAA